MPRRMATSRSTPITRPACPSAGVSRSTTATAVNGPVETGVQRLRLPAANSSIRISAIPTAAATAVPAPAARAIAAMIARPRTRGAGKSGLAATSERSWWPPGISAAVESTTAPYRRRGTSHARGTVAALLCSRNDTRTSSREDSTGTLRESVARTLRTVNHLTVTSGAEPGVAGKRKRGASRAVALTETRQCGRTLDPHGGPGRPGPRPRVGDTDCAHRELAAASGAPRSCDRAVRTAPQYEWHGRALALSARAPAPTTRGRPASLAV